MLQQRAQYAAAARVVHLAGAVARIERHGEARLDQQRLRELPAGVVQRAVRRWVGVGGKQQRPALIKVNSAAVAAGGSIADNLAILHADVGARADPHAAAAPRACGVVGERAPRNAHVVRQVTADVQPAPGGRLVVGNEAVVAAAATHSLAQAVLVLPRGDAAHLGVHRTTRHAGDVGSHNGALSVNAARAAPEHSAAIRRSAVAVHDVALAKLHDGFASREDRAARADGGDVVLQARLVHEGRSGVQHECTALGRLVAQHRAASHRHVRRTGRKNGAAREFCRVADHLALGVHVVVLSQARLAVHLGQARLGALVQVQRATVRRHGVLHACICGAHDHARRREHAPAPPAVGLAGSQHRSVKQQRRALLGEHAAAVAAIARRAVGEHQPP